LTPQAGAARDTCQWFYRAGCGLLSSVLRSKFAIQENIQIICAFSKLREMLSSYEELRTKIETMEAKYDDHFRVVFNAIKSLIETEDQSKPKIGF